MMVGSIGSMASNSFNPHTVDTVLCPRWYRIGKSWQRCQGTHQWVWLVWETSAVVSTVFIALIQRPC